MGKKLLITASTFPRWEEDTEPRFILDLAKELTKYYDVTVLVPACQDATDSEILEGVDVIRYHYFPIKKLEVLCYPGAILPRIREKKIRILLVPFLLAAIWLKLLRESERYDAIFVNWLVPQGIVQALCPCKTPFVMTGHGGDVTSLNNGFFHLLKRRALNKAKKVTVVSTQLQQMLEEKYQYYSSEVIPMGCDLEKFNKKYRVNNFFDQGERLVILFVGRLAEKKGLTYLLKAMYSIDALLIIVGDGPEKEKLKKGDYNVLNKCIFVGSKSHEDLSAIYASADIFCIPSIVARDGDREGLPTVILEAMASGLPVIGTDTGGIKEIIDNGINGFLVEEKNSLQLADRINTLIKDKNLRDNMSKNAILKVQNYSYLNIGIKYKKIIDSIIEE